MKLNEVLKSKHFVLIDFQSDDCPPCKLIRSELEKVSEQLGDDLKVFLVDQKEQMEVFKAFNVQSLPHLKLFKNGRPLWSYTGLISSEEILEEINKRK
jgi:thioredoxin 1